MASADVDEDGDIDLITKAGGIDFLDRLIILANDGSARFTVTAEIPLIGSLGGSPWDTTTADFDADGHLDLAWVSHALSSRRVAFLTDQGPGGPAFDTPEQTFFLDGFPRALVPVDLDNDQDLDVAVTNIGSHTMVVLENGAPLELRGPAASPPERTRRRSAVTAPPDIVTLLHFGAPVRDGVAPVGAGGPCGDPKAGDCFEPNGTPGCEEEVCCTSVCAIDPFCCDTEWDQSCADIALEECEMPACPGKFSCFETHEEEGCDDLACCELVTLIDVFCTGFWDQLCVDRASALCALEPCLLEPCPQDAIVEPETINCLDATNDGCNLLAGPAFTPVSCGDTICGTTWTLAKRDTDWYEIDVSGREVVTWEVASEFPAEILIVSGSCADTYTVAAAAYGAACEPASVSLALDPGTYYLFVAPGTEAGAIARGIGCLDDKGELIEGGAFTNRYTATVSCVPACVADIDGDGAVSTTDLLALIAAWGDGPGSPADVDGNGIVDTADMLFLLTAWGPCG
jgi:hypothetical protein